MKDYEIEDKFNEACKIQQIENVADKINDAFIFRVGYSQGLLDAAQVVTERAKLYETTTYDYDSAGVCYGIADKLRQMAEEIDA